MSAIKLEVCFPVLQYSYGVNNEFRKFLNDSHEYTFLFTTKLVKYNQTIVTKCKQLKYFVQYDRCTLF